MNCSIIIVSYNSNDYLKHCLLSIERFAKDAEVIVIDNQSSDGSQEMVISGFPWVQLIALTENIGFSAANNLGVAKAGREIIFLLNPDTELKKNAVETLLEYLIHSKEPCLVGPKLLNTDSSIQNSVFRFPTLRMILLEVLNLHKAYSRFTSRTTEMDKRIKVDAISGAAIMLKKKIFISLGGLDESLFWMEDMDLCYRAFKTGAHSVYISDATIVHHGGKSSEQVKPRVIANQLMSRLKYFKKHRSKTINLIAIVLVAIHIVTRLIFLFILQFFWGKAKNRFVAYQFTFKHFLKYIINKDTQIIL